MFWIYFLIGLALVASQAIAAYFDGYLMQSQMIQNGIKGSSFMEIAAVWADFFIISPLVAYILSHYRLVLWSKTGILILAALAIAGLIAGILFSAKAATGVPDAWNHGGMTTWAGRIHGVFALIGVWTFIVLYFVSPAGSLKHHNDLIWIATVMTPFFWLGIARFTPGWTMDTMAKIATFGGPAAIWIVTLIRYYVY